MPAVDGCVTRPIRPGPGQPSRNRVDKPRQGVHLPLARSTARQRRQHGIAERRRVGGDAQQVMDSRVRWPVQGNPLRQQGLLDALGFLAVGAGQANKVGR